VLILLLLFLGFQALPLLFLLLLFLFFLFLQGFKLLFQLALFLFLQTQRLLFGQRFCFVGFLLRFLCFELFQQFLGLYIEILNLGLLSSEIFFLVVDHFGVVLKD